METEIKKRILYVITKSNWGGAQRYVYDLVSSLKDQYEIAVAFGGEGELKQKLDSLQVRTIIIKNLERDVSVLNEFRVFFDIFRVLKSFRPNIIHLNSSKIGGLGTLAGRFYNVYIRLLTFSSNLSAKIIFTAHGWVFNENRKHFHKILIKLFHRITIFLSHKTICVSEAMADQIGGLAQIQNRISIIHNGIKKFPSLKKEAARNELLQNSVELQGFFGFDTEKRKKTVWIGSISELHKNKGLEYMIEALSLYKKENSSFVFVIIGDGEEKQYLKTLVIKKGMEKNVFFLGKIEGAAYYLKAFNIFSLTSITEGLPYVLLEAGMADLPTIASNIGGIPEIIDQLNSGILVRPKNPQEIKDAIIFLNENKMKGKQFGKNLKTKIETAFSLEKMITETKKIYEGKSSPSTL